VTSRRSSAGRPPLLLFPVIPLPRHERYGRHPAQGPVPQHAGFLPN
jgi:hypothetical protein